MTAYSVTIEAYRRILKAAKQDRGVRLSPAECRAISLDDAIATAVQTHDEGIKETIIERKG